MSAKVSRIHFVKSCLLVGFLPVGGVASASLEADVSRHHEDLESLKKDMPWASKWWNTNVRKTRFAVCLEEVPSFGQSRNNVHAWRIAADGSPAHVWSYRTVGIGPIEVEIEEAKSIISVRAIANTDFKDAVIAVAHLGPAVG